MGLRKSWLGRWRSLIDNVKSIEYVYKSGELIRASVIECAKIIPIIRISIVLVSCYYSVRRINLLDLTIGVIGRRNSRCFVAIGSGNGRIVVCPNMNVTVYWLAVNTKQKVHLQMQQTIRAGPAYSGKLR